MIRRHPPRGASCRIAVLGAALVLAIGRPAVAQAPRALAGVVRTEDDTPIYGARVTLQALDGVAHAAGPGRDATTSDVGAFGFADVGAGWAQLVVRRLGFRPETLTVEMPQPAGGRVVVPLQRVTQVLATVVVRAAAARGAFAAFEHRRAAGFGHFVTRADIERRRPQRTTDVLRNVPGLTVERTDGGASIPRFRNATTGMGGAPCYPVFWVDGTPLGPSLDLDALSPGAIEGIELYSGIATVPPALRAGSAPGTCGVVAIWTRHGEARARHPASAIDADQLDRLVAAGQVFTAEQVDEPARPLPGAVPLPAYPDSMRAARTAGRVVAEFVVDETGQPDASTFGIVSATHRDFADAVVAVLPAVRFVPAARRGRVVRQVVHLPVIFDPELGPRVAAPAGTAASAGPAAPPLPR